MSQYRINGMTLLGSDCFLKDSINGKKIISKECLYGSADVFYNIQDPS